jgi:AraC family transcriptional regulator
MPVAWKSIFMTGFAEIFSSSETISVPWRIFSTQSQWMNFRMDEYRWPAMKPPPRKHDRHMICFNMGMPLHFAWQNTSRWNEFECNTGNVVGLLSAGEQEEIAWEDEFNAFTIWLDPCYVDRLLETEAFAFREQRNLNDPFLTQASRSLYSASKTAQHTEKIFIESVIVSMVIHMATHYTATGRKVFAPKGKLSSGQLKTVIDYVRSYTHANISLTDLASCVHLSPFHFSRLFRQTLGISPYQYVLQMKIEHAKKMIIHYSGSLSEIAYTLNFTDQAHFSNVFKKVTGICPREFMQTRNG